MNGCRHYKILNTCDLTYEQRRSYKISDVEGVLNKRFKIDDTELFHSTYEYFLSLYPKKMDVTENGYIEVYL